MCSSENPNEPIAYSFPQFIYPRLPPSMAWRPCRHRLFHPLKGDNYLGIYLFVNPDAYYAYKVFGVVYFYFLFLFFLLFLIIWSSFQRLLLLPRWFWTGQ